MFFRKKKIVEFEKYESLIRVESFVERFHYQLEEYIGDVKLYINDITEGICNQSFILPLWSDKMPEKTEIGYNEYIEQFQDLIWQTILSDDSIWILSDILKKEGKTPYHINLYLTNDCSEDDESYKWEYLGIAVRY